MASTAMAELRSHDIGVPILFPIDALGIVIVSELHLSIRFLLKSSTIWVECEIFNPDTWLIVQTLHETSKLTDNGNKIWELGARKYRIYGLPESQITVLQDIFTSLWSSTFSLSTLPVIIVKTEPDVDNVIDLSDFLTEDEPVQNATFHDSPPLFPSASCVMPPPSRFGPLFPSVPSMSKPPPPIVQCVRRLGVIPGSRSVLKKLDYDKIKIQEVNHLLPCFNGTQLFVFLAAEVSSSQSRAKSMDGMDKQYDGHVWTKDSNHQHYKRCWPCILFIYLCWPSPMP